MYAIRSYYEPEPFRILLGQSDTDSALDTLLRLVHHRSVVDLFGNISSDSGTKTLLIGLILVGIITQFTVVDGAAIAVQATFCFRNVV